MKDEGDDSPGLTREGTFKAMVLFTTKMRDLGWPSLPGLLGGAQKIEGRRCDPAIDLEYLDDVVNRLSATASEENARDVAEDWRDALSGT